MPPKVVRWKIGGTAPKTSGAKLKITYVITASRHHLILFNT